jgi:hypothetical protein
LGPSWDGGGGGAQLRAKKKISATSKWSLAKLATVGDPRTREVAHRAEAIFKEFIKDLAAEVQAEAQKAVQAKADARTAAAAAGEAATATPAPDRPPRERAVEEDAGWEEGPAKETGQCRPEAEGRLEEPECERVCEREQGRADRPHDVRGSGGRERERNSSSRSRDRPVRRSRSRSRERNREPHGHRDARHRR